MSFNQFKFSFLALAMVSLFSPTTQARPPRCQTFFSLAKIGLSEKTALEEVQKSEQLEDGLNFLSPLELKSYILYHHAGLTLVEIARRLKHSPTEIEMALDQAEASLNDILRHKKLTPPQLQQQMLAMQVMEARTSYQERLSALGKHLKSVFALTKADLVMAEMMNDRAFEVDSESLQKRGKLASRLGEQLRRLDRSEDIEATTSQQLTVVTNGTLRDLKEAGHLFIDQLFWNGFPVTRETLVELHKKWNDIVSGDFRNLEEDYQARLKLYNSSN